MFKVILLGTGTSGVCLHWGVTVRCAEVRIRMIKDCVVQQ